MTEYNTSRLNVEELKSLARHVANNTSRSTVPPWTYVKRVYETVEKQHKTGGFMGFMQKTVTTSEEVRSTKTFQIIGEHWIIGERSECRSEVLSSSREFGAVREELIETTNRYVLMPNGDLFRATLVTDTLVRHLRDDDFSVESVEAVPFEEMDYLSLDMTMELREQQVGPTQILKGNMRDGQISVLAKGEGLRKILQSQLRSD